MSIKDLIRRATEARDRAYAPYSRFKVGAALQTAAGDVFVGCNIENASLGLTICAERAAVASAVSEGCSDFTAIAVVTDGDVVCPPCGSCRQVLAEFNPNLHVIMTTTSGAVREMNLIELLPLASQGLPEKRDV
jgi:cytidine deaminase